MSTVEARLKRLIKKINLNSNDKSILFVDYADGYYYLDNYKFSVDEFKEYMKEYDNVVVIINDLPIN